MEKIIIQISDDKELVEEINKQLKITKGICPCVFLAPDASEEEIKRYTCMCEPFRLQKEEGYCHCGKYFKKIEKN